MTSHNYNLRNKSQKHSLPCSICPLSDQQPSTSGSKEKNSESQNKPGSSKITFKDTVKMSQEEPQAQAPAPAPGPARSVSIVPFLGKQQGAAAWLAMYEARCNFAGYDPLTAFPAHLEGHAILWFQGIDPENRTEWLPIREAFLKRFGPTPTEANIRARTLGSLKQQPGQTLGEFATHIKDFAMGYDIPERELVNATINGADPEIRQFLEILHLDSLDDIITCALAHRRPAAPVVNASPGHSLEEVIDKLSTLVTSASVRSASPKRVRFQSPHRDSPRSRSQSPGGQSRDRDRSQSPRRSQREQFQNNYFNPYGMSPFQMPMYPAFAPPMTNGWFPPRGQQNARGQQSNRGGWRPYRTKDGKCGRCGQTECDGGRACVGHDSWCERCNRKGHVMIVCRGQSVHF